MASILNADDGVVSGSAGLKSTADSSGVLELQTKGTTGLTISGSQVVSTTNGMSIQGLTVGRGAGAFDSNTAVSILGLSANTTGVNNTALGRVALWQNTTGSQNSASGVGALGANTTGSNNTAQGVDALRLNTTASNNTAVGYQAGYTNTTGTALVAVGYQALDACTTGNRNTAVGDNSLGALTTGDNNTSIGRSAGLALTTGVNNTFVGAYNGSTGGSGAEITTGSKNSILGAYNGNQGGLDIRTSSNYIVLSDGDGNPRASCTTAGAWYFYNTGGSGSDVVNAYSGAAAGTGRSLFTGWYGATSPTAGTLSFNVVTNGNVYNTNNSYGALSDIKLKENIVDATPKLEKLCQVRVVNYNFKEGQTHKQLGVIAQELEQVFPSMVEETPDTDIDGNDLGTTTKSVKYSVFVPMLIKAIQELKAEFDAYKTSHP